MSLQFSLFKPPAATSSKPISLTSSFVHGSSHPPSFLTLPQPSTQSPTSIAFPIIRAMKVMQGKVVCATNDKTVNVLVTRFAPHPKYKRRVKKLKKYQAHDPDNQFKVGDLVQLQKCRPISKTKNFLALPAPSRTRVPNKVEGEGATVPGELGLPLESQSPGISA